MARLLLFLCDSSALHSTRLESRRALNKLNHYFLETPTYSYVGQIKKNTRRISDSVLARHHVDTFVVRQLIEQVQN